jgi:NAD(P)-dependent dehydrogenase (short-subunit alcohol dehydrogenase family)
MSQRTALVTGAGRGIGRAIAERLSADGYRLAVLDIDEGTAKETADRISGIGFGCDVSDPVALTAVAAQLDRVDVLVNNAAVWELTSLAETTVEQFHRVITTNLLGALLCLKVFGPALVQTRGAVVNITSITDSVPRPGSGVYPASKAALVALTKQAALEFAAHGVRVNAVAPGLVRTEGTRGMFGPTEEAENALGALLPLGRLGEPTEVADVVSFFASSAARYVSGQVIYVDGGLGSATFPFLGAALAG